MSARVIVALDVPDDQAADVADLLASVVARLDGEAGYLDTGEPVTPTSVVAAYVTDATPLSAELLAGAYLVGIEGAE